jgi:hypothetical protein
MKLMAEMTSAGRKIYTDKDGSPYSEKTVTLQTEYGWVNVPSVNAKGDIIPDDKLAEMLDALGPVDPLTGRELETYATVEEAEAAAQQRTDSLSEEVQEYAKGGNVKKDPVSGNEVPVGATAKEVRDDVPAMLSEGEFVLPADVVRYIGLDKLMKMREQAKRGLEGMAAEGQIGGGATDDLEMAEGGVVPNYLQSSQVTPVRPVMPKPVDPSSYLQTPAAPNTAGSRIGSEVYVGPNGERVTLRTVDGIVTQEIPAGYVKLSEAEKGEDGSVKAPSVSAPAVQMATQVCPPGQTWDAQAGMCVVQSSGGDQQQEETPTPEIDNRLELAKFFAEDDPKVAAALKDYEDGKIGIKDVLGIFSGLSGLVSLIGKGMAQGDNREALIEAMMESQVTGETTWQDGSKHPTYTAEGELMRDWAKSSRTSEEAVAIMEAVMDQGGSRALATALAVDDKFDLSDIGKNVDFGEWESSVADQYGLTAGSTQAAILAAQEAELFDGDINAYNDFMQSESNSDSGYGTSFADTVSAGEASYDFDAELAAFESSDFDTVAAVEQDLLSGGSSSFDSGGGGYTGGGTSGNGSDPGDGGGAISSTADGNDWDSFNSDSGSGGSSGSSSGGGSYCCTKMVEHGLWNSRKEYVMMHKWHMAQPQWWRDGYDVWGKKVANTLLKSNSPFWTSVMQAFFDRKVAGKSFTPKTLLSYAIIYPGVLAFGMAAKATGKHVHAAR